MIFEFINIWGLSVIVNKKIAVILAKKEFDNGNYKSAIKYFNKIKIKKDNQWIYADRAIAKMNINDYKGAIKDFNRVLKLEPKEIYEQKRQEAIQLTGK